MRSWQLRESGLSSIGRPMADVVGPLSEMPVSRPQYCFRVGIRALLTNGDNTAKWIASGCRTIHSLSRKTVPEDYYRRFLRWYQRLRLSSGGPVPAKNSTCHHRHCCESTFPVFRELVPIKARLATTRQLDRSLHPLDFRNRTRVTRHPRPGNEPAPVSAQAVLASPCSNLGVESARGISPRGAHRSGRKPLDLSGSCHPLKAAAFRQDQPVPPVSS